MFRGSILLALTVAALVVARISAGCQNLTKEQKEETTPGPSIRPIDPPEKEFFTKELDYYGIPIKAPAVVDDAALYEARKRMDTELKHLPNARYNLKLAGAELHIIG